MRRARVLFVVNVRGFSTAHCPEAYKYINLLLLTLSKSRGEMPYVSSSGWSLRSYNEHVCNGGDVMFSQVDSLAPGKDERVRASFAAGVSLHINIGTQQEEF